MSDAVITFNGGNYERLKVLEKLGVRFGQNTAKGLRELDELRVRDAELAAQQMTKEARKKRRRQALGCCDTEEETDYGPGQF